MRKRMERLMVTTMVKKTMRSVVFTMGLLLGALAWSTSAAAQQTGVLLMAHGGSAEWNARVADVAKAVDQQHPTEVALGMASRASLQAAVDRLAARGVTRIVAVPLFVSSHSSVITSTEYLLGLRTSMPDDLEIFAKMDHSGHGGHTAGAEAPAAADPLSPVKSAVPIRMTAALDRHPLVGAIIADRAKSISQTPATEAVILVAHGPVPDEDNRLWLADMAALAAQVQGATAFAAIDYMTVRDDAGAEMRAAATKELRDKVERQVAAGRTVLLVPHLLSYGGIEKGIKERLDGLSYKMTSQALMPDDRIVQWVLANVL